MRNTGILFAWVALATAQTTSAPTLPLSLKRAVEIALAPDGNARAQIAEEAIQQAKARAAQSRAAFLPDLETSVLDENLTRNLKTFGISIPPNPFFSLPAVVPPFTVFDARASVTQTVFDFGAFRRYQASRSSVDAAKADNDSTRDQVTDQVARAYLAALRSDAALTTAVANVELSQALLDLARKQKGAGTGIGIDITRAEVQLANDRQRSLEAETDRYRAHLQLLRTIGLDLDADVVLTDKLSYEPGQRLELAQALSIANKSRADLRAQEKREQSARLSYNAVGMERLPSLAAFADYGTTGTAIDNASPTRTYGVSLRIPVFDGGRREGRRAEGFSQYREEQIRTQDLKRQIGLDVRVALDGLRSANSQVAAAQEGLQLSENELAQAQRRYKAGVATGVEVTDAQTRLQRARDNQIVALYNYNVARIDLATAMGTIQTSLP
ncbi:MAG TPA: TolC family protein [Bryobacteraceae bacterium]|nr:TolC family protein [Bryobacteraceae bacterium]